MMLSELIEQLGKVYIKRGDIPVYDYYGSEITEVWDNEDIVNLSIARDSV